MSSTARRAEAYVDTSALIAFADASDSHHPLFRRLFAAPPILVTTLLVVAEGHAWFLKRFDRHRALQFLAMIEAMPLSFVAVEPADQAAAVAVLRRFSDQDLTLVDALGLVVMKARRCAVCWSTDFHLGLNGVPLVIHER
jgi:predicted nucleic acid-binding protein